MKEGVRVKTLRVIPDERGRLMEILRSDDETMVSNCPADLYRYNEPDEFRTDPLDKNIPYDWNMKLK